MLVFVGVVVGLALRGMSPEERSRLGDVLLRASFIKDAITKRLWRRLSYAAL
jgi:hypothetical protein